MADETWLRFAFAGLLSVANTKPLRWLMKQAAHLDYHHDDDVANTKPLRWLMKLDAHPDDTNNQIVANTKPLRWLMKLASSSPGSAGRSGRKYQAFTMADET